MAPSVRYMRVFLATASLSVFLGGTWNRLERSDPLAAAAEVRAGVDFGGEWAQWAADAYRNWPIELGTVAKIVYLAQRFPALMFYLHVLNW